MDDSIDPLTAPLPPSAPSTYVDNPSLAEDENTFLRALSLLPPDTPAAALSLDTFPPRQKGEVEEPVEFYQVEAGIPNELPILRRRDNGYVNGTKLLRLIPGMTKGVRDNILRSNPYRDSFVPPAMKGRRVSHAEVNKNLPRKLQGVWIPLASARMLAVKHGIAGYLRNLLALDPEALIPKREQPVDSESESEEEEDSGYVDPDEPDEEEDWRHWRREIPVKGTLAVEPYGWARLGREMAFANRGRAGRVS